jgi:hypothetical protein
MIERPIVLCLCCGYVNDEREPRSPYTKKDLAHQRRCDFVMTIRYVTQSGRITGGIREQQ